MDHLCCPHERSPPPEETALRWTVSWKRSYRCQKKRFKHTLKVSMNPNGITPNISEYRAQDKWHIVFKRVGKADETRNTAATEQHRELRNDTATSPSAVTIPCSHYPTLVCAQISLISHIPSQTIGWSDGLHRLQWTKKTKRYGRFSVELVTIQGFSKVFALIRFMCLIRTTLESEWYMKGCKSFDFTN